MTAFESPTENPEEDAVQRALLHEKLKNGMEKMAREERSLLTKQKSRRTRRAAALLTFLLMGTTVLVRSCIKKNEAEMNANIGFALQEALSEGTEKLGRGIGETLKKSDEQTKKTVQGFGKALVESVRQGIEGKSEPEQKQKEK